MTVDLLPFYIPAGGILIAVVAAYLGYLLGKSRRETVYLDEPDMETETEEVAAEEEPAPETDEGETVRDREHTVWYGTNRKMVDADKPEKGYSSKREEDPSTTHVGKCRVFVPKSHKLGELGGKHFWQFWRKNDQLQLLSIDPLTDSRFWRLVKKTLENLDHSLEPDALVYIHGYSCSFEDAAVRAAQIGADLGPMGLMAFFSWPSKGKKLKYPDDEAAIEASEAAIRAFLVRLLKEVGPKRIHILAHSMGNRGLLRVMDKIVCDLEAGDNSIQFGQIILAAPDVDADLFRELATAYPRLSERTTLYASPSDKALAASKIFHGAPRIGYTPPVSCAAGIDTVNVPNFKLDFLAHSYSFKARPTLMDMFDLIKRNAPPEKRFGLLRTEGNDGGTYWQMKE